MSMLLIELEICSEDKELNINSSMLKLEQIAIERSASKSWS